MPSIDPNQFIELLKQTMIDKGIDYELIIKEFGQVRASEERAAGKEFGLREHVRGLVLALLSNQRPWGPIAANLQRIGIIFADYDPTTIKNTPTGQFERALRGIKCANCSIHKQMAALPGNIRVMERIIADKGSLDKFVTDPNPLKIAQQLSSARNAYKLSQVGPALALEYLRNVGIRASKPDVHIRRVMSSHRLDLVSGTAEPSEVEAYEAMGKLADQAGVNRTYLDNLIWLFCAKDYGNICGAKPDCDICHLSNWCNYPSRD